MADAIVDIGAVPGLFQALDGRPQLRLILIQHGHRHRVKPVRHQLLFIIIAQQAQSCLVDADHPLAVPGMAHHTAIRGREDRLQYAVLLVLPLPLPGPHPLSTLHGQRRAKAAPQLPDCRPLLSGPAPFAMEADHADIAHHTAFL